MAMDARRCAGIDVGGTKCLGIIWQNGEVIREVRCETPRDSRHLVETLVKIADELAPFDSLGIGLPGLVTRQGVLRAAPNLVGIVDVAVGAQVGRAIGGEVWVDNDATCATVAEWLAGAAVGHDEVVVVTLGTGIGGGVISSGRLRRGAHGFAGEFGHMVLDPAGPPCVCGQNGCWERYASGSGLAYLGMQAASAGRGARLIEKAGSIEQIRGEHIRDAAADGDGEACEIIEHFARWVALGLTNLTNILDPEIIVIGGGLASSKNEFLEPIRRWYAKLLYSPELRPHPPVVMAHFGERAGAIGAALLPTASR